MISTSENQLKPAFIVKSFLCARNDQTEIKLISELKSYLNSFQNNFFNTGYHGLYVNPKTIGSRIDSYIWPLFDVEDKEQHSDIKANIEAGKNVLAGLELYGLTQGLQIILSGNGLRFCYPFLIHNSYIPALKALFKDLQYIDDSTLNNFQRLFAYRGNPKQYRSDKPSGDYHTHLLNDFNELWKLTEDDYNRLTKGYANKQDALNWIDKILPIHEMPKAWIEALEEYKRKLRFKNTAINIPRYTNYKTDFNQILSYLDSLQITYTKFGKGHIDIWKLSQCPICNKKGGNSFVNRYGYLKDFSTNCEAGERDDKGNIKGLPPNKWISEYISQEEEPIKEEAPKDFKTVNDAREAIAQAIRSDKNVLITDTPGAGKTTTALKEILPSCKDQKVIYACPTKAKAKEVLTQVQAMPEAQDINIVKLEGRNAGTKKKQDGNCIQADRCNEVAKKGFSPGIIVCQICSGKKECKYQKQFNALKQPGLFITTHEQAAFLSETVDIIIFDEDPTNSILKEVNPNWNDVEKYKAGATNEIKAIFEKINIAGTNLHEVNLNKTKQDKKDQIAFAPISPKSDMPTIIELANISKDEINLLLSHLAAWQPYEHETEITYQWRMYKDKDHFSMIALNWLLIFTGQLDGYSAIEIHKIRNGLFYLSYQYFKPINSPGRIIVLDGTGNKQAMEKLFNREFDLYSADVNLPDLKTVWIKQGVCKTKLKKMTDKQIEKLLLDAKPHIAPGQKILIGTSKIAEEKVKEIAIKVFHENQVETIHYKSVRGLNEYQDFNVYIGFGNFKINQVAAWKQAVLFFDNEPEQGKFIKHLSDSENLQNLHRIRPVNGGKTVIIIGKEWIEGLPLPDSIKDKRKGCQDQINEAYERIKAFVKTFGFFYRDIGLMLQIGCERDNRDEKDGWKEALNHLISKIQADTGQYNALYNDQMQIPFSVGFSLIVNIIQDKSQTKNHLRQNDLVRQILFKSHDYLSSIIERLRIDFPFLPVLSTRQTVSGKETKGIGSIENVKRFLNWIGTLDHFDESKWNETPVNIIAVQPQEGIKLSCTVEAETWIDKAISFTPIEPEISQALTMRGS